ncbi:hypothetical protein Agub_g10056 [Astrephomene gubernaculifera]|uniref:Phospholipase B-like n=1 Tax=Astrephomene gubernaculifera TaxID=47775 RepID=A0AAD3DUJ7_9CHLO|nr:hypothetical protein Agub_g10056 [Astrephomene gubernaculifera]
MAGSYKPCAGSALLLLLVSCYLSHICVSIRPAYQYNINAWRRGSTVSSGRTATANDRKPGTLDLPTLLRGTLYVVNVDGSLFKLARLEAESFQPQHLANSSAMYAHLRSIYPGENVGWAWYADTYAEDGWYRLEIRIDHDAPFPDIVKARAAGFVEGNLQGAHMYRYWTNYRVNEYRGRGEAPSQQLYDWLDEQYDWMTKKVHAATGWTRDMLAGRAPVPPPACGRGRCGNSSGNRNSSDVDAGGAGAGGDVVWSVSELLQPESQQQHQLQQPHPRQTGPQQIHQQSQQHQEQPQPHQQQQVLGDSDRRYWALAGLVAAQLEGLAAGFWAAAVEPGRNMTWQELYALNAIGDLYELNVLFPPTPEPSPSTAPPEPSHPSTPGAAPPPPPPPSYPPTSTTQGGAAAAAAPGPAVAAVKHLAVEGEVGDDTGPAGAATGGGGTEAVVRQGFTPVRQHSPPVRRYSPGHGEVGEYGYGELLECSAIIKVEELKEEEEEKEGEEQVEEEAEEVKKERETAGEDQEEEAEEGGLQRRRRRRVRSFWAAHNTWRSYYHMVRTWKVYDLPWGASGPLTVSSSPGLLHSKDDWYTTDKFVIMETTNGLYNKSLYDLIQPRCVLMWQRAQLANFGARSGSEWVDLFGRHNSGTYNNQWMVLDVPRLHSGRHSGLLWVLEQVPGAVRSRDVSQVLLRQGYWASYNVPYFPEIYNLTGYPHPSIYDTCPRAQIFRREQASLTSRAALMALMRLNRYKLDPLSGGLPNNAIAARYDLPAATDPAGQPRNWTRKAYGAVDAKVVDSESFPSGRTYVINGPTSDDQPPFSWAVPDPLLADIRHEGCVGEFRFGWQAYQSIAGPRGE